MGQGAELALDDSPMIFNGDLGIVGAELVNKVACACIVPCVWIFCLFPFENARAAVGELPNRIRLFRKWLFEHNGWKRVEKKWRDVSLPHFLNDQEIFHPVPLSGGHRLTSHSGVEFTQNVRHWL